MEKIMATLNEDIANSPIPSTIDKYLEAWYFTQMMVENYHNYYAFRLNLNAFIQAFRNITFMLQSEDNKPENFDIWYGEKQKEMKEDQLLRKFVCVRNLIVKKEMLESKSSIQLGVFRMRSFKLGLGGEIPPNRNSHDILIEFSKQFTGLFIDNEHSDLWEQFGIERKWIVPEIGDDEVIYYCWQALDKIKLILEEASLNLGQKINLLINLPDLERYKVLLETDLDPSLIEKCGWDK